MAAPGDIHTVAGNGTPAHSGDNGPATAAGIDPRGVTVLPGGGYLIADFNNNRIRLVSPTGTITTVAGGASSVCSAATDSLGDGCPATEAKLAEPNAVAALPGGGFLIADLVDNRIRQVSASGTITTVAGGAASVCAGATDSIGNGCAATEAKLLNPEGVTTLPAGRFLISDSGNHEVRAVSAAGVISRAAGGALPCAGKTDSVGDGCPATSAEVLGPYAVALLPHGGYLITDGTDNRVRSVSPSGVITTVAGNGTQGYNGDHIPAASAEIDNPKGIAVLPSGGFLVADSTPSNNRVREVSPSGIITTAAGTGSAGFSGDGGPAASAQLFIPTAVAITSDGGYLIADWGNNRVRRVEGLPPQATITAHPKRKLKTHRRKAKVSFGFSASETASTFACSLDRGPFRPCQPGVSYKVKPGRHTFSVRATNQFGETGAAATSHFKVVRKRHRRHHRR